jgi:hypothetical protein
MQDANPVGDAKAEASNDTAKPMIRTPGVEVSKDRFRYLNVARSQQS